MISIRILRHRDFPDCPQYMLTCWWKVFNGMNIIIVDKAIDASVWGSSLMVLLLSICVMSLQWLNVYVFSFVVVVFGFFLISYVLTFLKYIIYALDINKDRKEFQKLSVSERREYSDIIEKFTNELELKLEVERRNNLKENEEDEK